MENIYSCSVAIYRFMLKHLKIWCICRENITAEWKYDICESGNKQQFEKGENESKNIG